nr:hypothetical protein [Desulfovibrio sp.]
MADENEEIIDLTELIERGTPEPEDAKPEEEHVQALNDQKTLKEAAELDAMLSNLDSNKKKNASEDIDLMDMDKMLNELGLTPDGEKATGSGAPLLPAKDSGSPNGAKTADATNGAEMTPANDQNNRDELDLDALLNEALQTAEQLKGDTPPPELVQEQPDNDLDALLHGVPASAPASAEEDLDALLAQAVQPEEKPAP